MRWLAFTATVALAAAVVASGAAAATTSWHAEALPAGPGALPPPRTLAVDREGRALLLFEGITQGPSPHRFTGTVVRAPDGGWTRTPDIADIGWGSAQALLYGRTRALLVARQVTRFGAFHRARFRLVWAPGRSDGRFAAFRTIDTSADPPAVAADPAGDALVAYARQGGSTLRVSERLAGRSFGAPRVISRSGASRPAVAMNARGDRVVAWFRGDRIEARVRRAGHRWGSVLTVARVPRSANQPLRAVITPSGRLLIAWQAADVREDRPVVLTTGVAVRPRDAGWRSATIERATIAAGQGAAVDATTVPLVDSRGQMLVAYTGAHGDGVGVKLARVTSSAHVAATIVLSGDSTAASLDDAAAGPQARIAVTWAEHGPRGEVRTFVALRPGAGAFAAPVALTAEGEVGLVGSRVAFSPLTGQAIVARPIMTGSTATLAGAVSG